MTDDGDRDGKKKKAYNPLDIDNLGASIQREILSTTPTHLPDLGTFPGAGVYALYYTGDFPLYELVAKANRDDKFEQPVYVGKAVPEGGRKGVAIASSDETKTLSARVKQHRNSIKAAENLEVDHFHVRWLVVEPVWIPLGESLLITRFAPLWNTIVDGFGSNAAGKGRYAGQRSRWDTLHPGRTAAKRLAVRQESVELIGQDVTEYLRQRLQV